MFELEGQKDRPWIDHNNGRFLPFGLPDRERGHPGFIQGSAPATMTKSAFSISRIDTAISLSRFSTAERVLLSFAGSKKNTGPRQFLVLHIRLIMHWDSRLFRGEPIAAMAW